MRYRRALAGLFALLAILAGPGPGFAFMGDTYGAFGLDGSIRTVGAVLHNYEYAPFFGQDSEQDQYLQTILRLTAAGNPADNLTYEVHLVSSLTYFSGGGAPQGSFDLSGSKTRYRAIDDTRDLFTDKTAASRAWLDRFNVKTSLGPADLTLGRQAVTFGKTYFWNPLDVYLPFDPNQFDRDYKPGVDAARLDVFFGAFSGFNLVVCPGRETDASGEYRDDGELIGATWRGSSVLGRVFTTRGGFDLAVQGGKIYGGYQLGGGLVGELGKTQVRAETAWFWAEDGPDMPAVFGGDLYEDRLVGVFGLGRHFENSLDLQFEYLFNGAGEDKDNLTEAWTRYRQGAIMHMGRHLVGLSAGYDITPIVIGQAGIIYSLTDSSFQVQPTLDISLSDNASLVLGVNRNFGQRPASSPGTEIRSEFGSYPDFYFAEVKFYF